MALEFSLMLFSSVVARFAEWRSWGYGAYRCETGLIPESPFVGPLAPLFCDGRIPYPKSVKASDVRIVLAEGRTPYTRWSQSDKYV